MLSMPSVNDLISKVGNRYEVVLAVAKRARYISAKRLEEGSNDIKDAVDIASHEIFDEKTYVIKNGEYVVQPKHEQTDNEEENQIESSELNEEENNEKDAEIIE